MKIGHFGPTFIFPGKTVNFFGVKHVAPSSTLKMRKSHKKSARVYAYTHAYTQLRDGGGRSASPGSYRVKVRSCVLCTRVSHFYTFFELSLVLLTTQAHGL